MKLSSAIVFASIFASSALALPLQGREPQANPECGQQVVTVTVTTPTSASVTSLPSAPTNVNLVNGLSLQQIDGLTPPFGFQSGVNPTGTGDCDGAVNGSNGRPIKIPCICPPPRDQFIQSLAANIAAGHAVNNPSVKLSFPTDNSKNSILARFNAASVTLQNLRGPGVGCPIVSTTWSAQADAVRNGQAPPASVSAPAPAASSPVTTAAVPPASSSAPAPAATSAPPANNNPSGVNGLSFAQIDALTPAFGFQSGVNPTGTGDCDGAVNGSNGKPIKIPCACPPPRDQFIQSLVSNIAAGQAVNNPSVKVTFPTGNSVNDQLARFTAASITLQNLNGPGKGCPIVSTTWTAQSNAIRNGQPAPAPVASNPAPAPVSSSAAAAAPTSPAPAAPAPTTPANVGGALSLAQIDALTPDLGHQAGVNPTGTGDCDGAVNGADGKPIKVPCACPPPRAQFIQSLATNIAAGRAVNNPSVGVKFPTDNSKQSQITRLQASLVTLQNLNGSGKGCPASSTTLLKQLQVLQA